MIYNLLLMFSFLCASSCTDTNRTHPFQEWREQNGKIKILSTTAMIDDLVKQIGGEHVDTTILIKGDLDPHSYQLVKGDDEKIAFADLIFYNGLGLEHGPSLQSALLNSIKATSLGDLFRLASPTLILNYKGQIDPHIWMDVSIWSQTIPYIVKALSQKDPSHVESYKKNGNALQEKMNKAHLEMKELMHKVPASKRYLVTSHDAFNYFSRAYLSEEGEEEKQWMERFTAPEGLAPESQISATDIQGIINHLRKYRVHVLFSESNVNRDSIRKIVQAANEQGIKVKIASDYLYADAMGSPGSDGDTYLNMIQHDVRTIAKNLDSNGGE